MSTATYDADGFGGGGGDEEFDMENEETKDENEGENLTGNDEKLAKELAEEQDRARQPEEADHLATAAAAEEQEQNRVEAEAAKLAAQKLAKSNGAMNIEIAAPSDEGSSSDNYASPLITATTVTTSTKTSNYQGHGNTTSTLRKEDEQATNKTRCTVTTKAPIDTNATITATPTAPKITTTTTTKSQKDNEKDQTIDPGGFDHINSISGAGIPLSLENNSEEIDDQRMEEADPAGNGDRFLDGGTSNASISSTDRVKSPQCQEASIPSDGLRILSKASLPSSDPPGVDRADELLASSVSSTPNASASSTDRSMSPRSAELSTPSDGTRVLTEAPLPSLLDVLTLVLLIVETYCGSFEQLNSLQANGFRNPIRDENECAKSLGGFMASGKERGRGKKKKEKMKKNAECSDKVLKFFIDHKIGAKNVRGIVDTILKILTNTLIGGKKKLEKLSVKLDLKVLVDSHLIDEITAKAVRSLVEREEVARLAAKEEQRKKEEHDNNNNNDDDAEDPIHEDDSDDCDEPRRSTRITRSSRPDDIGKLAAFLGLTEERLREIIASDPSAIENIVFEAIRPARMASQKAQKNAQQAHILAKKQSSNCVRSDCGSFKGDFKQLSGSRMPSGIGVYCDDSPKKENHSSFSSAGNFINGYETGYCKMTYSDNAHSIYHGETKKGKRDGNGINEFKDDEGNAYSYKGSFKDDSRDGLGLMEGGDFPNCFGLYKDDQPIGSHVAWGKRLGTDTISTTILTFHEDDTVETINMESQASNKCDTKKNQKGKTWVERYTAQERDRVYGARIISTNSSGETTCMADSLTENLKHIAEKEGTGPFLNIKDSDLAMNRGEDLICLDQLQVYLRTELAKVSDENGWVSVGEMEKVLPKLGFVASHIALKKKGGRSKHEILGLTTHPALICCELEPIEDAQKSDGTRRKSPRLVTNEENELKKEDILRHAIALKTEDDGCSTLVDPGKNSVQLSEEDGQKFKGFKKINEKELSKNHITRHYKKPAIKIFKLAVGEEFAISIKGAFEIKRFNDERE